MNNMSDIKIDRSENDEINTRDKIVGGSDIMCPMKGRMCQCSSESKCIHSYSEKSNNLKQRAREMFDEKFPRAIISINESPWDRAERVETDGRIVKDFIDQIIDLAIAEERKRIVEMIREFAEPYENSKWLNEVNAHKIINLITNTKK